MTYKKSNDSSSCKFYIKKEKSSTGTILMMERITFIKIKQLVSRQFKDWKTCVLNLTGKS